MIERVVDPAPPPPIVWMFALALPLAILFGPVAPWYYWGLMALSWYCIGKWVYDKLTFSPFK